MPKKTVFVAGKPARSRSGARAESSPMMEQFWKAKKEQPDALLFFRMGDFYELFHEDAEIAARELGIALTARSKGDALIVGVNDDASVTRLKGPSRPVNGIDDRMEVLAALEVVDAVVPFHEDTPKELVEQVSPDVLVKGEDYKDKVVVGAEWVEAHGGQVVLAPLLEGRSTTGILERSGGDAADGGDRDGAS